VDVARLDEVLRGVRGDARMAPRAEAETRASPRRMVDHAFSILFFLGGIV